MRGVATHAVLLLVALVLATVTWALPEVDEPTGVVVWEGTPETIERVSYVDEPQRVEVERRTTGERTYLWARVTRAASAVPPTPADSAADPSAPTVEEYPVGDEGTLLIERLATLTAIREFGEGADTDLSEFGIVPDGASLSVAFAGADERRLLVGDVVRGGGAFYAADPGGETVYVLGGDLINPFRQGGAALRLTRFHDFEPGQVRSVVVRAGGAEQVLTRGTVGSATSARSEWFPEGAEIHSVEFGLFLGQLDNLWIQDYVEDLPRAALQPVVAVDYRDQAGRVLSTLEIVKSPNADGTSSYFARTPRTVAYGRIYSQGEGIEEDVANLMPLP